MRASTVTAAAAAPVTPPLDLIAGAIAAFSLRKARTAFAGKSVNVRRASDDTVQDIGFTGNDLDIAAFSSFIGGGGSGFSANWYDQTGNGHDASESAYVGQPQVMLGATPSGRPTLYSNSTSVGLIGSVPAITIPLTLAAVVTRTGLLTNYSNFFDFSGNAPGLFYANNPSLGLGNLGIDGLTVPATDNQFHSVIGVMNGASSSVTLDGVTTPGTLSNHPGSTTIVAIDFSFIGSVCEAIYFAGALTAPNIATLAANQKSYWGTP